MATESPEMERTSFVRRLWQDSDAPLQVGSWRPRGAAAMHDRKGVGGGGVDEK